MENNWQESKHTGMKIKLFLAILVAIAALTGVFYFGFQVQTYHVVGCDFYSEQQIVDKVVKTNTDHNTLLFYLKSKYHKEEEIPFIEKMEVEIVDRNTVNIHVYEKTMIGCIDYMGQILYFDKDGVVVESSKRKIDYVPSIVGLKYDRIVLNEPLEIEQRGLLETILNLTQLIRKYQLPIEKIVFSPTKEVTLISKDVRILLGKHKTYDEHMANLKNILPKTEGLKGVLNMTDFNQDNQTFVFKPDK